MTQKSEKTPISFEMTPALVAFRQSAGDSNRHCNTALVGIETIRHVRPVQPKRLLAGWSVPTGDAQWTDARQFVLGATMVAIVDGVDKFLRVLSRIDGLVPVELHDALNGRWDPGLDRRPTVAERVAALCRAFPNGHQPEHVHVVELLSLWRNRFVHKDYRFNISPKSRRALMKARDFFANSHGGADISHTLNEFDTKVAPSMPTMDTMYSSVHRLLRAVDQAVLYPQTPAEYASALVRFLVLQHEDPEAFLDQLWKKGGAQTVGRIHALLLFNGGQQLNHSPHAPFLMRSQLEQVIPFGRNEALVWVGLRGPTSNRKKGR